MPDNILGHQSQDHWNDSPGTWGARQTIRYADGDADLHFHFRFDRRSLFDPRLSAELHFYDMSLNGRLPPELSYLQGLVYLYLGLSRVLLSFVSPIQKFSVLFTCSVLVLAAGPMCMCRR